MSLLGFLGDCGVTRTLSQPKAVAPTPALRHRFRNGGGGGAVCTRRLLCLRCALRPIISSKYLKGPQRRETGHPTVKADFFPVDEFGGVVGSELAVLGRED